MAFTTRVKNSFIAMLLGLVLVPASIGLHAWNEYRTIHRSRGLEEAEGLVVSIPNENQPAPELDKQLVHLTGLANTDEVLVDPQFGVRENAIHLAQHVEMYQWIEEEESDDDGGKRYDYHRGWHEGRVNSEGFHHGGYDNPQIVFHSFRKTADHVAVGVYKLNRALKDNIDNWTLITPNRAAILETLGPKPSGKCLFHEEALYWGRELTPDPKAPHLGDTRIRFKIVSPTTVSLVSMLSGDSFQPYTTSNGEQVQKLYVGQFSAEQVMRKLRIENALMAWGLRAVGVIVCIAGFSLILGPIKALVSWIPLVGEFTGFALFFVGALIALVVSLTTIAIAWIFVRPLLGVSLLAISLLVVFAILKMRKSVQGEPPVINRM